jgi:hypothetical protein
MDKEKQIAEWQKRLEDTFSYNEIVGGRWLLSAMDQEDEAGKIFVHKYRGFRVLTDSFLDFFGETISGQVDFNRRIGWPQDRPYYVTVLMMYVTMFRIARAAELVSVKGYPLQAYSMLRGLKDQIWILCGAANNVVSLSNAFG